MKTYIAQYSLLLMLMSGVFSAIGQDKVHVITKTIVREFENPQKGLIVQGEKSNINFSKSEDARIHVTLKLIAKNTLKSKAESDLTIMKYTMEDKGGYLLLNNFFQSDEIVDITSNLHAEYSIAIPQGCFIKITNLYGELSFGNVHINGSINNSFGKTILKSVHGSLDIQLNFSDLTSQNLSGIYTIQSKNSDILMTGLSGNFRFNTTYGNINISDTENMQKLAVDAQRTTINVEVSKFESYNYELTTKEEKINLPANYKTDVRKESGMVKFLRSSDSTTKSIIIKTTFCPITIKTK